MTLTVSEILFEVQYDEEADIIYLRRADRGGPAAQTIASAAGHAVRYDAAGEVIGFTIVNAKEIIGLGGRLDTPEPVDADELAPALC